GEGPSTTQLASHLKVRPASVTGMVKRLGELGLVAYRRYGRVNLTPAGQRGARAIVRRHRLAERLLTDVLELPLDRVHDEACRLEHALSPEVEELIARKLGDPQNCPHGHPIKAGSEKSAVTLAEAPQGRSLQIVRIEDESPEVVRYLAARKLLPEATVTVREREPVGGAVVLDVDGETQTLGRELAATIRVRAARKGRRS
ncbi:MAG: metal-dependent transcriptional regulator, partial [Armatimonadetes bacterium]|nr:metal-dependent transcriptional regulator [Armatimonadota bacterium]